MIPPLKTAKTLLSERSRAEKMLLLQWVVADLGEALKAVPMCIAVSLAIVQTRSQFG